MKYIEIVHRFIKLHIGYMWEESVLKNSGILALKIEHALNNNTIDKYSITPMRQLLEEAIDRVIIYMYKSEDQLSNDWLYNDNYSCMRSDLYVLLELAVIGLPRETLVSLVKKVSLINDPILLLEFIRLDITIETNEYLSIIHKIAAYEQTRVHLYELLVKKEQTNLFPNEYCSNKSFAESSVIYNLTQPYNIGRYPDMFHYVANVSVTYYNDVSYYFVFKYQVFSSNWKRGWNYIISGPFQTITFDKYKSLCHTFIPINYLIGMQTEEIVIAILKDNNLWKDGMLIKVVQYHLE